LPASKGRVFNRGEYNWLALTAALAGDAVVFVSLGKAVDVEPAEDHGLSSS
jgi:hypothetical protein